jgi:hypothetical protein
MLFFIVVVSSFVLFVVAPVMALCKYYSPSTLSIPRNIFCIIVGIITWPLVPFVLALRNRNVPILSIFAVSLLICMICSVYFVMNFVATVDNPTMGV